MYNYMYTKYLLYYSLPDTSFIIHYLTPHLLFIIIISPRLYPLNYYIINTHRPVTVVDKSKS